MIKFHMMESLSLW